jgi:hypothetical protein
MRIVKTRPGRVGTLATLILMFSIVLFAGTLFWLITDTGFITGNRKQVSTNQRCPMISPGR